MLKKKVKKYQKPSISSQEIKINFFSQYNLMDNFNFFVGTVHADSWWSDPGFSTSQGYSGESGYGT